MKFSRLFAILALALGLASCGPKTVVSVEGGKIRGIPSEKEGITVFKGIPYAAAPVGELRWREPQPVAPWTGVRNADTFSDIAWQADLSKMDLYGKEFYSDGMPDMSEDCLYLNVWAPSKTIGKAGAKLPVAFWIHGGAFDHGWGSEITMDGDAWAERGVILVTINYRVGVLGFLAHDLLASEDGAEGRSGNYALYDQLAALKWVHDNIAGFGGDPDNITIMGQSAGARSVQNLLACSLATDMIAKAIIQSGGGINRESQGRERSAAQVRRAGKDFCNFAGLETLEQMRSIPAAELMRKYEEYVAAGNSLPFGPMIDMNICGTSFTTAAVLDKLPDIPYMIGYTTRDGEERGADIDQFCASRNYFDRTPAFEYKFTRRLPGDNAGAFHSAELWYMFGTLDRCWRPFTDEDYDLSADMLDAWTAFCRFGNPCGPVQTDFWPAFTQDNPYRKVFDVK